MPNSLLKQQGRSAIRLVILILILAFIAPSGTEAREYIGFRLLVNDRCKPVQPAVFSKLPAEWQRYRNFTKTCELTGPDATENFMLVSVWVEEYFNSTTDKPRYWEKFPHALILNAQLHIVGQLPVVYPQDDITSPDVFYGKWAEGIPTEIRVDVENPAEGGDYYYAPLIWEKLSRTYRSKTEEAIDGRRPE
jgi:hypothetical protein